MLGVMDHPSPSDEMGIRCGSHWHLGDVVITWEIFRTISQLKNLSSQF